jgi:hypothetical protein
MKKLLLLALVALLSALPALAQSPNLDSKLTAVEGVIHLGTLDLATGQITADKAAGDIIWDATVPTGFFRGSASTTEEVIDEGDLPAGTVVQSFQIGFATDAVGTVGLQYAFYTNNQFNTVGAPLNLYNGDPAVFDLSISGLVGGGFFAYTLNVNIPGGGMIINGPDLDLDGDTDWGWGVVVTDFGNATALGPSITGLGPAAVGAPGAADLFDVFNPPVLEPGATYAGTFFFGGNPFAQFYMQLIEGELPIIAVPTLDKVGLVALMLLLAGLGVFLINRR